MTVLRKFKERKLTDSCLLCEAFDGKCTNKASVNFELYFNFSTEVSTKDIFLNTKQSCYMYMMVHNIKNLEVSHGTCNWNPIENVNIYI